MHIYNMVNCLGLCTSVLFIIIIIIIIITTISFYCTELLILFHFLNLLFLNLLLIITMIILIWVILKPGMNRTGMG